MLPNLIQELNKQHVIANAPIKVVTHFGAISVLDCGNGPGRYASSQAMQTAMNHAQSFGVGVCLAKNTTHWGRAHAYAAQAAIAGLVGICTTNAMPTMAIGGAKKPVIGNNPLAIGIPGVETNKPIVLDMAMSQAAVGKVNTWLREGKEIPANWGIDAQGNPTNNARDILAGAVLPIGEHKGAGLALMLELLTAALAGAAFTQEILAQDKSGLDRNSTKLFIALNPQAFIAPELFHEKVADFLQYLSHTAAPFHYPGERGWATKEKSLREGVALHVDIVEQLASIDVILQSR
jgi:LDH2 family malate/lactate/ureidoglycolate dehydrogenase